MLNCKPRLFSYGICKKATLHTLVDAKSERFTLFIKGTTPLIPTTLCVGETISGSHYKCKIASYTTHKAGILSGKTLEWMAQWLDR